MVKASFEALASLETAMEVTKKANPSNSDRLTKTMLEICSLVEKMMDADEKEMEKNYEEWSKEFEDKTDILIANSMFAEHELKKKISNG